MKKIIIVLMVLLLIGGAGFLAFRYYESNKKVYTIMYTDGEETYTLQVKHGELYSIPKPLPSKKGYVFMGLYDAEVGGTQYVSSTGVCITAFYDDKNLVLFPQFRSKTIKINLDYCEAASAGDNNLVAEYGEILPQLPANVIATESEKFIFDGWYADSGCSEAKVAEVNGISNLKIDDLREYIKDDAITLYAGFKIATFEITFYDCNDFSTSWNGFDPSPITTISVEYGALLSDVAPILRKNGETILSWSLNENSQEFTGQITSEQNFYVREYTVAIEYNTDGEPLSPTFSSNREGVNLKKPVRDFYSFNYWVDDNGNRVDNGFFDKDITLSAIWTRTHYSVTYVTNGGSFIQDAMVKIGDYVQLPSASKQCCELIGWKYQDTIYNLGDELIMPSANITLTAQWNKTKFLVSLLNDHGPDTSIEVLIGSTVQLPSPSVLGYTFNGWLENDKKCNMNYLPQRDVVLKASWSPLEYVVTLNANGGRIQNSTVMVKYNSMYEFPVPEREGYQFCGWYNSMYKDAYRMTDDKGKSLSKWSGVYNCYSYAVWVADYKISLAKQNCKDTTGYNTEIQGNNLDKQSHSAFELVEVILGGCAKNPRGEYYVPSNSTLTISLKVLQDILNLPRGGSMGSNWYTNKIFFDNNVEVIGTNISGNEIKHGAYYLKVNYTDGSYYETNGTDFLNGMKKDEVKTIPLNVDTEKSISSIEVVVVYEILYSWYDGWWHDGYSNWRCTNTIEFEK